MGVRGWGWPISTSVVCCGTASFALMNIATIPASTADVITALMICAMFNTAPLFAGMVASFDRKNSLPHGCRLPVLWGTKHSCGVLVACRLHGMLRQPPLVTLCNWGIAWLFSWYSRLGLLVPTILRWIPLTSCCILLLHITVNCQSLAAQTFYRLCRVNLCHMAP